MGQFEQCCLIFQSDRRVQDPEGKKCRQRDRAKTDRAADQCFRFEGWTMHQQKAGDGQQHADCADNENAPPIKKRCTQDNDTRVKNCDGATERCQRVDGEYNRRQQSGRDTIDNRRARTRKID
ncbi:MAG: hypothetical protein U1E66_03055 [Rhodospirillales bacterium]